MNAANNAVLAVRNKAFPTLKGKTEVSGSIRKQVLALLGTYANYDCLTKKRLQGITLQLGERCVHGGTCEWTCFPGIARLVADLGWGETTINRALVRLAHEALPWIFVEPNGRGKIYRLNRQLLKAERDPETWRPDTTAVAATAMQRVEYPPVGRPTTVAATAIDPREDTGTTVAATDVVHTPEATSTVAATTTAVAATSNNGSDYRLIVREEVKKKPLPLRVVKTGLAKKRKLANSARNSHPLHTPVQRLLEAALARKGVVAKWGGGPRGALGTLLASFHDQQLSFWKQCIDNLEFSDRKHLVKDLSVIIAALPTFQLGAKDSYGNVLPSRLAPKPGVVRSLEASDIYNSPEYQTRKAVNQ